MVQAATIALAWFTTLHDIDNGFVVDKDFEGNVGHLLHGMIGIMVMPVLALILLIVSFFAKVPGGVKWAGLVLLAVILQVVLAIISFDVPAIGALHGINALVLAGVAGMAAARAGSAAPDRKTEPAAA
ncbi:MAG: hypothetical protein M3353_03020 [Actinomycetota bacterium]|nr:hypothetical protein [Actinomycetota bacterium]